MGSILLFLSLLAATGSPQQPALSFKGYISLPVDLYSSDGTRFEKGKYVIEVRTEGGHYSLAFLQEDQLKGSAKGDVVRVDDVDESGYPFIGTQYLHPSDVPIGTEAQRHFSKTGLPQYEEENRDWRATLRAYTADDQKETRWLFEQRQPGNKWSYVQFKLYFHPK